MNAARTAALALLLAATASVAAQAPATYSPRTTTPGNSSGANSYPFGLATAEYQQIHSSWSFSQRGPLTVNALRMTPRIVGSPITVDMQLWMAKSPHGSNTASRNFSDNEIASSRIQVMNRRRVSLPATTNTWDLSLPFDRPFQWDGGHLSWRLRNHGNGTGSSARYAVEFDDTSTNSVRTGTFDGCSAPQGSFTTHYGILRAGGSLRPSQLFGRSGLTQRAVPAVINFGLSATDFGGAALPFDLGVIGMTGCMLTNSVEATLPTSAPASDGGSFRLDFDLPTQSGLGGSTLYTQVAFLDPGANQMGVFLSPGATHVVPRNNGCARIYGSLGGTSGRAEPLQGIVIGLDGR